MQERPWWLTASEDYGSKFKCWRSEDRFLMDKLWRLWRLEDSEDQDEVSTHASPTDIWSLWSLKTNVTVSKEVQSTKSFIPRPYHQDSKRTHVAVLSNPWVTLILRSQEISNGYILKGLYKKIKCSHQYVYVCMCVQASRIHQYRNGQELNKKKYTKTL